MRCVIQILSYSCAYERIIYEKTKGQIYQRPSLHWENKTSKLTGPLYLEQFHDGRKFDPQSLADRAALLPSPLYPITNNNQKRKTEWLLLATASRGVAGIVAVMVCFSDFFIVIAIAGECLCFLRM